MSINSIINNSLTGLFTNQAALRVTSNNVANVNTPGYARQVVRQEAIINGTAVGGVKISGIDRVVDKFLVKASYDANADFSRYEVESAFHSRIQSLLGRPDQNKSLSGKIDDIFSAISEVALNPLSAIQKERALSAIDQFGSEIGSLAEDIQTMRLDASNQIAEQVARINALTERIHTLNPLIIKETLTGGEPGALTESREQAIAELSTIMDINIVDAGNNSVQITTTSGVSLVSAVQTKLQYSPPGVVTSSTPFSAITVHRLDNVSGAVMPSTITLDGEVKSGKLKGLLTLRDKDLPEIALQLGSMASGFTDEMNRVHNMNSAVPGVNLLTGVNTGLLLTDNHNFTGETVFAVTDASGDLVSKVNIDFSAIGPTVGDVVTAVNAGLAGTGTLSFSNGVMSLTATNAAHGITMSEVAGNESSRGGRGFSHFFGLNNLVQSKSPAHFETGVVGTDDHGFTVGGTILIELNDVNGQAIGTHTLTVGGTSFNDILTNLNSSPLSAVATFSLSANGELITTPNPGAGAISVHVKNDTTTRGTTNTSMSAFFGIGEQYKMDSAIDLKVSDRISTNPSQMALARLDQTALVGDNVLSVGDQAGALALKELETVTRTYSKAGGLSATTVTLAQYSANLLADLGLRSALADNSMSDNKALSEELNRKATDVSGVNMDEELGNMVIYQNAYSASARLLTTAKEMYDTILQIL
ncbi:flagellar hook-associated protein FlgK [Paremcibacter congregatus]|uniref:flagellar hook-associated protein FlgK n=1 Tax=Paremcibacter congregatus TaxID=2043170 RepID=UPI0030EBE1D9|tara:strand:+ start:15662 stop:17770 length:2109 start_codon:yes stop_codon:yes gene_type:complete